MATFTKDPDATLDYESDWSAFLAADSDTITNATVTATSGITVSNVSWTDTIVTYWLSGGTDRQEYSVTVRITTAAGRIDDRTDTVKVQNK